MTSGKDRFFSYVTLGRNVLYLLHNETALCDSATNSERFTGNNGLLKATGKSSERWGELCEP